MGDGKREEGVVTENWEWAMFWTREGGNEGARESACGWWRE